VRSKARLEKATASAEAKLEAVKQRAAAQVERAELQWEARVERGMEMLQTKQAQLENEYAGRLQDVRKKANKACAERREARKSTEKAMRKLRRTE